MASQKLDIVQLGGLLHTARAGECFFWFRHLLVRQKSRHRRDCNGRLTHIRGTPTSVPGAGVLYIEAQVESIDEYSGYNISPFYLAKK